MEMIIIVNNIKAFMSKGSKENKIKIIGILAMIIIGIVIVIGVNNNYSMYDKTIGKITNVKIEETEVRNGPNGEDEQYYRQEIEAEIKNGENKGNIVSIVNTYGDSLIEDEKYSKGDDIFMDISNLDSSKATIIGVKRDSYVVVTLIIFIITIVVVAGKYGVITILTIIFNITALIYFVNEYIKGGEVNTINNILILTLTIATLTFIGGFTKKTLGAIISTIITIYGVYSIYLISLKYTRAPHYEFIEYQLGAMNIESITLLGMLVGCLGAVMDVCITINSAVNELIVVDENITVKSIIKSIREIGHDIMGTMINVLMFSYVSGSLTIILIKLANGYSMKALMKFDFSFEIIRFLVGAIGIVAAVPISGVVAVLLLKKGWKR